MSFSSAAVYTDKLSAKLSTESSIGNVKTLRSKLQARRVTLSEAIEKENLFLQGSERLASLSNDPRTKDQASLQKDFAESKIKSLQAELTKINSSLHAYQAESARGVQVPIIPLAMKTTARLNVTADFSDIIRTHYHTDPAGFEDSLSKFNHMRESLESIERSESGLEILLEYYKHVMLISKRFFHSELKHGVTFIWYDAITGLPASQQSTVFERACVCFNIGALYSQLAAKVDRCSQDALDSAIVLLEKAIGAFEYTKVKFTRSPMMDMTSEILSLISDLMRAQAQEMVWEKEVMAGLKGLDEGEGLVNLLDYSHKTKSVAECYKPIRDLIDADAIKDYLPDVWISLIKIKEAHYKALAHYYAAVVHKRLAAIFEQGSSVPEDVRTEIRFLYSDCPQEILTNHPKLHIGIAKSHINCAVLSHEYALKFCNLCRDLHHISQLTKMLSEAESRTQEEKEEMEEMEGVRMIAPTILPCATNLRVQFPSFTPGTHEEDLFQDLGPMPPFTADHQWSPPRTVLLFRAKGTFGIFVRGSQPVVVSGVDENGSAEKAGVLVKDWVLTVNSTDVRYKSHDEVVAMVKECKEEVTLEITTPSRPHTNENGSST